ncbi:MAG: tetratricopeptide repeat protein [Thermodesulfobacteriota bacterium]
MNPVSDSEVGRFGSLRLYALIVFAVAVLVNLGVLGYGFVLDDLDQVLGNRFISSLKYLPDIFTSSVSATEENAVPSNYYRPVMHFVYMLTYQFSGLKPWGFHLVNLIFSALNSVLVLLLATELLKARGKISSYFALMAGLFFAVHPIHSETASYVACVPELFCAFFFLLSVLFYIRGRWLASVPLYFLALLSKETAIALIPVLFIYSLWIERGIEGGEEGGGKKLSQAIRRLWPHIVATAVYLFLRYIALGGFTSYSETDISASEFLVAVVPLFIFYLQKLILPTGLNPFHAFNPYMEVLSREAQVSYLFLLVALAHLILFIRKGRRAALFALALLIVPLIPALYLMRVSLYIYADRYLYLPSVGFVILLSLLLRAVYGRIKSKSTEKSAGVVILSVFIVIFALYATLSVKGNRKWKDSTALISTAIALEPGNYEPRHFVGTTYLLAGEVDRAITELTTAVRLNLNGERVDRGILNRSRLSLATAYRSKGVYNEAEREIRLVLELTPGSSDAYFHLGLISYDRGRPRDAIASFKEALKRTRYPVDRRYIYKSLGAVEASLGLYKDALESLEAAKRLGPTDADVARRIAVLKKMLEKNR